MTVFLIVYDRSRGEVVSMRSFAASDRATAEQAWRRAEHENPGLEVVLLQADSEDALKRTHGRYFVDLDELIDRAELVKS